MRRTQTKKIKMALPLSKMSTSGVIFHLFYIQAVCLWCIIPPGATTLPISTTTLGGNETDRLALLAFKSKILQDPQGVVSSWNDSLHFCDWQGIMCSHRHRRVSVIDLNSRGLVGSLSPYIGNLSFLRRIVLSNNSLQGEIPHEIGRLFRLKTLWLGNNTLEGVIPSNLSQCSNLIQFSVDSNKLEGKIPLEFASLSKLKILSLHDNNLTGGFPPFVGNMTSIEMIRASKNSLGGQIPHSLGQLQSLFFLSLGGNKLSGIVPPPLYNLSSIITFSLALNELHGSLPSDLGLTLPSLEFFQIWGNQFTGIIPVSLSNASRLRFIEPSSNNFTGQVEVNFGGLPNLYALSMGDNNLGSGDEGDFNFLSSLANCSNLQYLILAINNFGGSLPNSVTNLSSQLLVLPLARNRISGSIPSEISNLVKLMFLNLHDNQFTGTIPTQIGDLRNLQRISLASNRLSGKIPSSLGNLSLLNELYLEDNKLEGTIPPSLGNSLLLVLLNLSQNNLSGAIPNQLFRALSLSISLNLAQNHLVGSLPSDIGHLKTLVEFDVSENELSGVIPNSLSSCTSLENLYMGGNFFQGSIPLSLKSLRGLQNVDLSHNNFSGKIPEFLGNLLLKHLNLSFNDFEGEVLVKGIFTNASAVSLVGNNRLCGGIFELQLPKCNIDESRKNKVPLVHILIISFVCLLLAVTIISSFLCCFLKKRRNKHTLTPLLDGTFLQVSYERLLKATDGFSLKNLIGVGGFGSVYKGILGPDETIVAIKVLNLQRRGASKSFMAECDALRNIRHRNLVKIITACSSIDFQGNEFKALVYEFMPHGNLERWLHSIPEIDNHQDEPQTLNLHQRVNIAYDVACALDYLHNQGGHVIIHCDLKPNNILLDRDMVAHVGDFGLARFLPELSNSSQSSSIGIRGTIGYAAPEYGMGSEVSTNGDVYSYGILLLEMLIGKKPTDPMFEEGPDLHTFARMALPDRVMEILDPVLLKNAKEEAASLANNKLGSKQVRNDNRVEECMISMVKIGVEAASLANNKLGSKQVRNDNRVEECMISMVKIGVGCSMNSPQDRMDISNVICKLHSVKKML